MEKLQQKKKKWQKLLMGRKEGRMAEIELIDYDQKAANVACLMGNPKLLSRCAVLPCLSQAPDGKADLNREK